MHDMARAFGGVRVAADDWQYNPDNKKLTFANGRVILPSGRAVAVSGGVIVVLVAACLGYPLGLLADYVFAGSPVKLTGLVTGSLAVKALYTYVRASRELPQQT